LTGSSNTQSGYHGGESGLTGTSTSGRDYDTSSTSQTGYGNNGGVTGALSGAAAAVGLGSGSSTSNTQSGYGSGSGLTSGSGLGSGREPGVFGTPGYSKGVDGSDKDAYNYGGVGHQTHQTSGIGGTSTHHDSSTSTSNYGSSGLTGSDSRNTAGHDSEGFLSKVMSAVGLGGHEDTTSSTHGTSGSTSGYGNTSSSGYGSSGLGNTAGSDTRYEGEGVGQTERLAGGSSSMGYGSSTGTSGVTGTSSSTGLGSSSYGTSGLDSESYNSSGGSRVGDAARELKRDVTYGGERGGTGNGAAEGAQVNKDKVMY